MRRKIAYWLLLLVLLQQERAWSQIAIKADTIYTVTRGIISHGVILIKNKSIENIGTDITIPSGYTVYEARVVTPGLIDARSQVGISGPLNITSDQDQIEKSSPLQPDLRAIDAYNPEDKLVEYLRANGVTTIHTGHGVGALVSGQTIVVKTKPGLIDQVLLQPLTMIAMTLGPAVGAYFASPGTRSKEIAMLREELVKAQDYMKKKNSTDTSKRPAPDLNKEVLIKLLHGEIKGMITANTSVDILSAIRLAKEFGFKLVLEGVAEGYRVIDDIKASGAEVIVHPTMGRAGGETANLTMENAAILTKAGISVSIESGCEGYVPKTRVILFEAAVAVGRGGLPFDAALQSITMNPAKLLGLDKRLGSIEKGKDADLVLYSGDPFEYTTKVCRVIIDGQLVSDNCSPVRP
ncbi:MAG: amidohydrolase family protein [Chitinophagales bacterium]